MLHNFYDFGYGIGLAFDKGEDAETKRAAGVIFITPDQHVLMLQRSAKGDHEGTWCFPGGMLEGEETPVEAARREAEEETGFTLPIDAFQPFYTSNNNGLEYTTFIAEVPGIVKVQPNDESTQAIWRGVDNLPQPLHPGVVEMLKTKDIAADAREAKLPHEEVDYGPGKSESHCGICKYYIEDGSHCQLVEDPIEEDGWCELFADAESSYAVEVDRNHDGPWLSCMSKDGETMYVNSNLPRFANIEGKIIDVDEDLIHHEVPELEEIRELLAEFEEAPGEEERKQIYLKAHKSAGTPGERNYCEEKEIDWDALSAWFRGEESRLENLPAKNPPEDADVKPIPHGHGDLEITLDGGPGSGPRPRYATSSEWTDESGEKRGAYESKTDTSNKFTDSVKAEASKHGFSTEDSGWKKSGSGAYRTITVKPIAKGLGFAQVLMYKHPDGSVTYQQHDVSLPEKERGKGTGGKMMDALIQGFKAAGVSNIPIHMNTNPSFWNHLNKKYKGIYSQDAGMSKRQEIKGKGDMRFAGDAYAFGYGLGLALDALDAFHEEDHPRGQPGNAGQFTSGSGGATGAQTESGGEKKKSAAQRMQHHAKRVKAFLSQPDAHKVMAQATSEFLKEHGKGVISHETHHQVMGAIHGGIAFGLEHLGATVPEAVAVTVLGYAVTHILHKTGYGPEKAAALVCKALAATATAVLNAYKTGKLKEANIGQMEEGDAKPELPKKKDDIEAALEQMVYVLKKYSPEELIQQGKKFKEQKPSKDGGPGSGPREGKLPLSEKRRLNKEAFSMTRFYNKLKNEGEKQEKFVPPHPDAWEIDHPGWKSSVTGDSVLALDAAVVYDRA